MCYIAIIFPGNSAGKGSACNAGDPGSIPGSGRYSAEGLPEGIPTPVFSGFPGGTGSKESAANQTSRQEVCTTYVGRRRPLE